MAKNVVIYSWPGLEGLPSLSPFSLKPIIAARVKGIDFDLKYVRRVPSWVASGKLPAAMINDTPITDSTNIMQALDSLASDKPLLYPTDTILKAEVCLLEDWADESLFWYMVSYRFGVESNFKNFSEKTFAKLKWPLRTLLPTLMQKTALKRLKAQGLGCVSDKERDARFKELCEALDQKLLGRSYFVGSHLTAADVAIYAQLKQITHLKLSPAFSVISELSNLMAFMSRMEQ